MELWQESATGLAARIGEGEVSSREVVEAHLARIAKVNDSINAVTSVLEEGALRAAEAADEAVAAGEDLGPLHGVPMTVKENIDLEGSATTQAVVAMKDAVPSLHAPHVRQLLAAGAVPIGRTNLPDFGFRWQTDNDLHGPTRNPWAADRSPGGSSGGDAAALATGMTPLGNGNDYGGSLRVPSQFCGTAAIKPTTGRIPQASALAPFEPPITIQLFAVQGPMARHVEDLRTALEVMSGRDARDPWWTPAPLAWDPGWSRRVAMTPEPAGGGTDPRVAAGVRRAGEALADAGWQVEEAEPPGLDEAGTLWRELVFAEIRHFFLPQIRPLLSVSATRFLDLCQEVIPDLDLPGYMTKLAERQRIARMWAEFHQRYPLILGPVSTSPPFLVGCDVENVQATEELLRSMRLVVAVNLLGLPAAAVPVGRQDDGLPQGVQLIGDRFSESLCLDAAQAIEERLGAMTPIELRHG